MSSVFLGMLFKSRLFCNAVLCHMVLFMSQGFVNLFPDELRLLQAQVFLEDAAMVKCLVVIIACA